MNVFYCLGESLLKLLNVFVTSWGFFSSKIETININYGKDAIIKGYTSPLYLFKKKLIF